MKDQLRILVVDDNPDDRALAIRELQRDFSNLLIDQITDATNFALALESDGCDLVITDYQLRWSDGLAVLRAVKHRWPDCTVIMFTGTGSEEVAVEAMKAGLDDYVLKASKHYARLPGAVRLALERKAQWRRGVQPIFFSRALILSAAALNVMRATHCPSSSATYRKFWPPSRPLCR